MWSPRELADIEGNNGELRAWHLRGRATRTESFQTIVRDVDTAAIELARIAERDLKDDSVVWNAQGLVQWEDGEWSEWYSDDGLSINEIELVKEEAQWKNTQ